MKIPDDLARLKCGPDPEVANLRQTDSPSRKRITGDTDSPDNSELIRIDDLDEDLRRAAAAVSTHKALDGAALVESVEVERLLAERRRAIS
jgi:hypothetical protein